MKGPTATSLHVLIVEDELLVAMEMEESVRAHGHSVLGPAETVDAADALLDEDRPDAALLDVNLRGVLVTPIARRLREMKVPYALVTGYSRPPPGDPALSIAPRLNKPVSEAEVAQMLLALTGRTAQVDT